MPDSSAQLYEEDFVRWTEQQAAALREAAAAGTNLPLDWENLAEEIDSLGRATRRELRSRIATIIEHLLKLECSTAAAPRRSWRDTIARERNSTEDLLEENPSLRNQVADMVVGEFSRTARLVVDGLGDYARPRLRRAHGSERPDTTPIRCWVIGSRATLPIRFPSPRTAGRGTGDRAAAA
jgi:Domain of unknown function DUF29